MGLRNVSVDGLSGQAAIDGEMTIYTIAALKSEIEAFGSGPLDIDLSAVSDIDTAGLQWLLMAKRLDDKQVRFIKHSPAVLQMLDLTNLAGALGDPLLLASDQSAP